MKKIVWFRFDLRTDDNCAFLNACNDGDVLPIFIYDKGYWELPTSSSFHLQFTEDSLEELKKEGKICEQTLKNLAHKAYSRTASYDATISNWMNEQINDGDQTYKSFGGKKIQSLMSQNLRNLNS